MGSGTSRGKKIAPACVSESKGSQTNASVASPKRSSRPSNARNIHAALRNSAQPPDCNSEGHDSDFSAEDDDREQDRAVANHGKREIRSGKKASPKKTFLKCRTYGLCHFSRGDAEDDFGSSRLRATEKTEEPRGSCGWCGDVNKRSGDAFNDFQPQQNSSTHGFLIREASLEAVPTSEKQTSSLTTPVILYDGSEEELMDTIEREFS